MALKLKYIDIETTGLDPKKDKLVTIQTFDAMRLQHGAIHIYKVWEFDHGEKTMLEKFLEDRHFLKKWEFVPLGFNLSFEYQFLYHKLVQHGLIDPFKVRPFDFIGRPSLDLLQIAILFNELELKGASLHKFSSKRGGGGHIPTLYMQGEYAAITAYVEQETRSFRDLFLVLREHSPGWWKNVVRPSCDILNPNKVILP